VSRNSSYDLISTAENCVGFSLQNLLINPVLSLKRGKFHFCRAHLNFCPPKSESARRQPSVNSFLPLHTVGAGELLLYYFSRWAKDKLVPQVKNSITMDTESGERSIFGLRAAAAP
jgi:hypothetical protein